MADTTSSLVGPGNYDALLQSLLDRVNALEQTSILPVGMVVWFPGAVANGFLALDGSTISAARYGQLVAYLGTTSLPDVRGRVLAGKAATGTFLTLGSTGGVETVTLASTQSGQPAGNTGAGTAHSHGSPVGGNFAYTGAVAQVAAGAAFAAVNNFAATTATEAAHTHAMSAASAAAAHTNLQPYVVMIPAIKF